MQIYTHWLSCYSVSVDTEREGLALPKHQFSYAKVFTGVNTYTVNTNLNTSNVSGDTALKQIEEYTQR